MCLLFLDCEFNGFGGDLLSMALVPEDKNSPVFYKELSVRGQLHPWVRDNVIPHMMLIPSTMNEFQLSLSAYLLKFNEDIIIVADWPDDIRYFCEVLITGPGECINIPKNIKFELNMNIEYTSEVPHNALWDARAIRDAYYAR